MAEQRNTFCTCILASEHRSNSQWSKNRPTSTTDKHEVNKSDFNIAHRLCALLSL